MDSWLANSVALVVIFDNSCTVLPCSSTKYWLESARHDLETAESMFQSGKYDWCLSYG
ncbi:MAG: HEPN domain-containing protein [Candidatus Electrothrix sp. AX2]|nr:HEPN domain-containing protein [Candidatus Electrothrix gigas]